MHGLLCSLKMQLLPKQAPQNETVCEPVAAQSCLAPIPLLGWMLAMQGIVASPVRPLGSRALTVRTHHQQLVMLSVPSPVFVLALLNSYLLDWERECVDIVLLPHLSSV